LIIIIKGSI